MEHNPERHLTKEDRMNRIIEKVKAAGKKAGKIRIDERKMSLLREDAYVKAAWSSRPYTL